MCQRHTRQDKYIVKSKNFRVSIEVFFTSPKLSFASDFRRIFAVTMLSEQRLGYLVKTPNFSSLPMQMLLGSTSLFFFLRSV